jgi:hypothetical protein
MGGHSGSGSRNPFAERRTHERQHHVQVHANRWVNRVKLDIPEFQVCLQTKEFLVTEKIKNNKKRFLERRWRLGVNCLWWRKMDLYIKEDCSIDWASPPIYDTYLNEDVSSIHQVIDEIPTIEVFDLEVDFLGVYAILSKKFSQKLWRDLWGRDDISIKE